MKRLLLALIMILGMAAGYSQTISPDVKTFTMAQGAVLSDSLRLDYGLVPAMLIIDTCSIASKEIEIQVAIGDKVPKKWINIKAQAGYDSVYAVLIGALIDSTQGIALPLDYSIMASLLGTFALDNEQETIWIRLKASAALFPYETAGTIKLRLRYL